MPPPDATGRELYHEAAALLAAAGWSERDIARVLHLSLSTVLRVLKRRPWEVPAPSRPEPMSPGTCSQRVGDGWCDAPVRPGEAFCAEHWRSGWPQ